MAMARVAAKGILIGPSNPDIVIVNNLIYGNGQEAIRITGSKGGPHYIVHNTIHDNRREGVDITKGQTVVLLNNLITVNGADSKPKAQLVGVRRAQEEEQIRERATVA